MLDLDTRALAALYVGPNGNWRSAMIALTVFGGGWAVVALVPLLAWPRTRGFARPLSAAIATQAIAVWAIKRAVGRVRPWLTLGLAVPFGAPRDGSFPSGHASGSFCVAAFFAAALPAVWHAPPWLVRLVATALTLVAAFIALSRVVLGAHFPSDVLAGALMGSCIGATAGALHSRQRERERTRRSTGSLPDGREGRGTASASVPLGVEPTSKRG